MSPEQAKGKRVDQRTDIWAFGAVLYEMLSCTKAFPGEDASEVLAAVIKLEPDWTALPPDLPSRLTGFLGRCLKKDLRQRLHHVGDVRILMEEASHPSAVDRFEKRGHGDANPYVAAVVTAGLASGLTWFLMSSPMPASGLVTRTVIPLASDAELALGGTPAVAISPNGRSIVYAQRRGTESVLYLRRLDLLEPTPIDGTEGGSNPFLSPDGRWLAFRSGRAMRKVSLSGGTPVVLGTGGFRGNGDWNADGSIVLSDGAEGGLVRISDSGGEPETLTHVDSERREKTHRMVDVLPDGNAALFTLGSADIDSFDDAAIAVLDLASGEHRILIEGGTSPHYSPSGHIVYARNGSLLAVVFDPSSLQVTGAPVTVLEGVATSPNYGHAEFDISRNGTLVYAPGGSWGNDYRVVWVDREGRTEPLIETPRAYVVARLSPDGRAVALGIDDANASVWVHDLARGTQTRLASGYNNLGPIWTPRGDRVTFRRNHPTGVDLRWRPADGSDDAETLSSSEQQQSPGSWTSDGTTLLFHGRRPESGDDILTLSLDDDRTVSELVNTESNERSPMISPNDRWLAYESDESGRWEVYVQAFPDATRKVQVSTDGGVRPRWNPNGQELFYRQGDKLMAVEIETEGALELDTPRALFERFFDDYDVGPLGERFIMVDTSVARAAPRKLVLVQNWSEELKRLVPTEE